VETEYDEYVQQEAGLKNLVDEEEMWDLENGKNNLNQYQLKEVVFQKLYRKGVMRYHMMLCKGLTSCRCIKVKNMRTTIISIIILLRLRTHGSYSRRMKHSSPGSSCKASSSNTSHTCFTTRAGIDTSLLDRNEWLTRWRVVGWWSDWGETRHGRRNHEGWDGTRDGGWKTRSAGISRRRRGIIRNRRTSRDWNGTGTGDGG